MGFNISHDQRNIGLHPTNTHCSFSLLILYIVDSNWMKMNDFCQCVSLMGSNCTTALLYLCQNYFFKSPGLDKERSAYGDETVRYFQLQMYIFHSEIRGAKHAVVI